MAWVVQPMRFKVLSELRLKADHTSLSIILKSCWLGFVRDAGLWCTAVTVNCWEWTSSHWGGYSESESLGALDVSRPFLLILHGKKTRAHFAAE